MVVGLAAWQKKLAIVIRSFFRRGNAPRGKKALRKRIIGFQVI
jgi:hypothetical protein